MKRNNSPKLALPDQNRLKFYRPHQRDFHRAEAPIRGFVGGRGSGKTHAGAADLLARAWQQPGLYGVYAPTFGGLTRYAVRKLREIGGPWIHSFSHSPIPTLRLTNGTEILCGSLDNEDAGRGPSFRGVWIDEAGQIKHEAFINVLGSLRSEGRRGWVSCTFTPRGRGHWTFQVFGTPGVDVFLVGASSRDNPFLPDTFVQMIRGQTTARFAEQELEGRFIDMTAGFIERSWFKIVREAPKDQVAVVRYWDLAATPITTDDNDPDFTAGAKVALLADGRWIILDMRHARLSPQSNQALVAQTAAVDGRRVPIRMEEEGGASGKSLVDHYARNVLVGFDFLGIRPSGDKLTRAMPWMAAAEAGNVLLLDGPWVKDFLDEAESFSPDCKHDDQVDAVSGAFNEIAENRFDPQILVLTGESAKRDPSEPEPVMANPSDANDESLWTTLNR